MEQDIGRLIPTGIMQEVTTARQRHARSRGDELIDYATKAQVHLWVVLVQHQATDALLDNHDGVTTEPAQLDADTMLGPPLIGCYICEESYEPRLRLRKCPGEPS